MHAKVDDDERARLLQRFAEGSVRVLVATDVLARGIDTLEAKHVIQVCGMWNMNTDCGFVGGRLGAERALLLDRVVRPPRQALFFTALALF